MTKVSEFTARIALLRPDLEPDGQGGYHDNGPKVVGHVWAQFLKPRFWDGQTGGGPATEITQGIVIRYRADITPDWQVEYRGARYRILHTECSPKRDTLILTCEAVMRHG